MFVLTYFVQDEDLSRFSVVAVSKDRSILECKKAELSQASREADRKVNEWLQARVNILQAYFSRQKHALTGRHHTYSCDKDKLAGWIISCCPWDNWAWCKEYFDVSLATESPPDFGKCPKCEHDYYITDSWGGQGLSIEEVEEI